MGAFLTLLINLSFPTLGNLIKKFQNLSNPHPLPALPPHGVYIDRCINSIVPLFSSDNGIKLMRVFMGNLSCKMLKCHFVNELWSKIYAPLRTLQHTMAANEGVTKAIASFFPTWLLYGLSYLCYDLCANIIPANFFWVKCVRFSPCHDRDFRKPPVERRLPKISDDFPKTSERCRNAHRCSEDVWAT